MYPTLCSIHEQQCKKLDTTSSPPTPDGDAVRAPFASGRLSRLRPSKNVAVTLGGLISLDALADEVKEVRSFRRHDRLTSISGALTSSLLGWLALMAGVAGCRCRGRSGSPSPVGW